MPVTPFHFGPGILLKSAAPKRFSLTAFITCQIVIDFETAINMLMGRERLHTFFHSYLGSTVCAVLTMGIVLLGSKFLRALNHLLDPGTPRSADGDLPWTWSIRTLAVSSIIGAWSHVLLDSVMHSDITPFAPFSEANPLLGVVSVLTLHVTCFLSGVIGCGIWLIRRKRN